jgi:long-chain fatty acid transport protein
MGKILPKWSLTASLVTIFLLFSQNALAGGFYLPEIATPGSVGTAGVANVTNVDDASSAFTNPAGMTALEADEVVAGMEVLISVNKFDSDIATAGGSDGGNAGQPAVIPGLFVVKGLNENLKLGFSIAAVAGGGLDYGENFVGRYQAYKAVLQTVGVGPSLGYKINDMLSIGAGVYMIQTTLNEKIAVDQSKLPVPAMTARYNSRTLMTLAISGMSVSFLSLPIGFSLVLPILVKPMSICLEISKPAVSRGY